MRKILFVGGGSLGHIAPAVAVWQAYQKKYPEMQAHFVCSQREEDVCFLRGIPVPFTAICAPRFSLGFVWKFFRAYLEATQVLRQFQPHAVFSKGGYVSVPVCFAAHRKNIPVFLHESDVVSGRANRIVARWARKIFTGFPPQKPDPRYIHTGNPIREMIPHGDPKRGLKITGLSGERPILLVMGGSQGSQTLNETMETLRPKFAEICDVIHITGKGKGKEVSEEHYWARPFVGEELPHLYACTTIAVSRAGAGSISELSANGIPSILVPLRGVGHDHQQKNAAYVERMGGCILLQQTHLMEKLYPAVRSLLQKNEENAQMAQKFSQLQKRDAATNIATLLEESVVEGNQQF